MLRPSFRPDDRGQAYSLEALIAAILLLSAILFAVNSVVITPTSGGTLGPDVQAEFKGEAQDALTTAEHGGELTYLALYFNESEENDGMAGDWEPGPGFQEWPEDEPFFTFGDTLDHVFEERGQRYNVELAWHNESGVRHTEDVVFQGSPGDEVVVASKTVTLTDDMQITDPEGGAKRIGQAEDEYPIPNLETDDQFYNSVEVRVIVW